MCVHLAARRSSGKVRSREFTGGTCDVVGMHKASPLRARRRARYPGYATATASRRAPSGPTSDDYCGHLSRIDSTPPLGDTLLVVGSGFRVIVTPAIPGEGTRSIRATGLALELNDQRMGTRIRGEINGCLTLPLVPPGGRQGSARMATLRRVDGVRSVFGRDKGNSLARFSWLGAFQPSRLAFASSRLRPKSFS